MGKSIKLSKEHLLKHKIDQNELEQRNWKMKKIKALTHGVSPKDLRISSKEIHGHFEKMHIWPISSGKRGPKI